MAMLYTDTRYNEKNQGGFPYNDLSCFRRLTPGVPQRRLRCVLGETVGI